MGNGKPYRRGDHWLFLLRCADFGLIGLIGLIGCDRSGVSGPGAAPLPEGIEAVELASAAGDAAGGFERLEAEWTGIDFVHRWEPQYKHAQLIDSEAAGGGVCIGDYDGDGLPDVFLTRPHGGNRLYRNLGGFRFQDVTASALGGPDGERGWGLGAAFADIDNDGDLDLYVCGYDCPNRLWINQGDGTFRERAALYGLDYHGASVMMAFADYDLDGDLDGYLLTNRLTLRDNWVLELEDRDGQWVVPEKYRELADLLWLPDGTYRPIKAGQFDHLYRNDGNRTFTDVSAASGIGGNHFGLSAIWWDYDDDGLPDLYVANDFFGPDHLYRNRGDGTFVDLAASALPHTPWFSMGTDAADLNNDGRLDLMGSDMMGTTHYKQKLSMGDMNTNRWFLETAEPRQYMRNAVYINTGTPRFLEAAYLTGLAETNWTWSIKLADLDNDGRVDVFVTNGMTRDWFNSDLKERAGALGANPDHAMWLESPKLEEPNMAFRNQGNLRFTDVSRTWGLDDVSVSFGAALADLDRDGDLDLVVNNFEAPAGVYRNRSSAGNRLLIRLEGTVGNRFGVGATVRAETKGGVQVRHLTLARGFMSSDEPLVHFGLGPHATIDRLTVRWPSGHVQRFEKLPANRLYTIREPDGPVPSGGPRAAPKRVPAMFARSDALEGIEHRETPYNDYARQPLLPNKLSQLGPGVACGDVDGDGDDDLYLAGAAGQGGTLCINDGAGVFRHRAIGSGDDVVREEMAPLFFDADADGDLDLYVVSGGVECDPGDEVLRDRLFLNDGGGSFTVTTESRGMLPDLRDSGGAAAAADFDRDGDLDLFVGGRVIPGRYPLTPESRLLLNESGRGFMDATDRLAPALGQTGLVTAALWSDADGDGWVDLLVAHEWGPVKLFGNEGGRLVDRTRDAGLSEHRGWWNGLSGRDIDNDGDIDYVATNVGLNTRYHASDKKPVLLFVGDLDGTGRMQLVEAEFEGAVCYPVRGRSCSTHAMPSLGAKFPTFENFALSSIEQIYTPERLSDANRFEANALESVVLINDGSGRFTIRPLPRLAQIAPAFGVVLTEVDGDGNADLYLAQNFFSPQPETGRMAGGVSLLLTGNGDTTFEPVWPDRSGLLVPGDAKGLAATDLNGDGWVDFVVGINDGAVMAFENRGLRGVPGGPGGRVLTVRLRGPAGNPTCVGARIRLFLVDGTRQCAEVHAGGGYLSQSSAALFFGLGSSGVLERIEVRWPDGQTTSHRPDPSARSIVLEQSAADE